MATPGSWIGKTSVPSKIEPDPSWEDQNVNELIEKIEKKYAESDAKQIIPRVRRTGRNSHVKQSESSPKTKVLKSRQVSKEVSENTHSSRPKRTHSASQSKENSSTEVVRHAIHQNIKTGVFWCDCEGFKSNNEADANYHMMQNSPKMAKKPYIRKPHLTDRPLADNEALKALRDSLPEAEKFNPGKKPRNKENN